MGAPGAQAIGEMIMELKRRGKTVLLCSHLLAQVEGVCNHVAILNHGKLVAEGAVADLLRRPGVSNLAVENLTPAARAEVEAALARHGAKLRGVGEARVALDEFFLDKIGATKPAEKKERP